MSPSLTIAILGASGNLGPFFLQALAAHPKAPDVHIRILTRRTSFEKVQAIIEKHKSLSITVHEIDYSVPNTGLDSALTGVDVVVSTVGDDSGLTNKDVAHTGMLPGFKAQDAVAQAAKTAGVRLFVPACVKQSVQSWSAKLFQQRIRGAHPHH
jgi:uncharacterized protein YbjT (DUF2867 family)